MISYTPVKALLRSALFAIFFPALALAQINAPPFQHLTVDDGLPQNSITALAEGQNGFLWIGTQDGLARYDGYNFKIFRAEENNARSLSHNFIWDLYVDDEGMLWITTLGNGLSKFDPKTEKFSQYLQSDSDTGLYHWNTFSTLKAKEILWVGTNESLDKVNLKTGKRKSYYPGKEEQDLEPSILVRTLSMAKDSSKIWMNSKKGLAELNLKDETFRYYPKSPYGKSIDLTSIYQINSDNNTSIITTGKHVIAINWKEKTEKILYAADSLKLEPNTSFHGFYKGIGRFNYIYSGQGIFKIEKSTNRIIHLEHDPYDATSLTHNHVLDLCETSDGALWVGTRNGLNAVRTKTEDFTRFGKTNKKEYALSSHSVRGMIARSKDQIWVGTNLGINQVDLSSGRIDQLNVHIVNPAEIGGEYILSLMQDAEGTVWAGSKRGGLASFTHLSDGYFKAKSDFLNGSSVQYILDEDSILWLGCSGQGLLKYHKKKKLLKSYPSTGNDSGPSHTYIYALFRDPHNILWLGTPTGGINLFDRETEKFITIRNARDLKNGLSGNTILCFFQDSKNRLWIGTSSGLSLLKTPFSKDFYAKAKSNPAHVQFEHFGRNAGFPNEVIYGIQEDGMGNLWISTNDGLVKFNGEKVVDVYTMDDGCQMNEYNQNAYLTLPDGRMAFGGVAGFHVFHPKQLGRFYYPPKPVITDVLVNHEPLSEKGIETLPHALNNLNLSYADDILSFSFAGLCYVNSTQSQYAYRLVGFDQDWNTTASDKRFATYTNLDPGKYKFEVKAANCDGVWSNKMASLPIAISYPPWQSWYAFVGYVILISTFIYLLVKWRTERARRKERLKLSVQEARLEEREKFRKEAARDFHDEAGNKITRINLLVELAHSKAAGDEVLSDYFRKIAQNTSQLSAGMRDFNWSLDPEKDSLKDLIFRITQFGESMYEGSDKAFSLNLQIDRPDEIALSMAMRRDILMIFKEAIHNAVKYSGSNKAELCAKSASDNLIIELRDFGKGMDTSRSGSGYGLKNMESRARAHKAELNIFYDKQYGTIVRLILNLPQMG